MADAALRRVAREGSCGWRRALLRAGQAPLGRWRLAAALGHPDLQGLGLEPTRGHDAWEVAMRYLGDRELRLLAADCAERALLREREAGREPPDLCCWEAVDLARAFARGEAKARELEAAHYLVWGVLRDRNRKELAWSSARFAVRAAMEAVGPSAATAARLTAPAATAGSATPEEWATELAWQRQRAAHYVLGEA